MKFAYEAFDPAGKVVTGVADAPNLDDAAESIRRQGLYVMQMQAGTALGGGNKRKSRRLSGGARLKNLAMFTRQLAVLVSSGTTQVDALGALERQAKHPRWKEIVASLRSRVEEGSTLSEAMAAHTDVFDAVSRSLIAAGESGGGMDVMLDRVATLVRRQMHLRQAVVGAMIYPILLIFVAIGVLLLMLLFVLPRFTGLFSSLDTPLPPTTKVLMQLSDLLRSYWWAGLLGMFTIGAGVKFWLASAGGKRSLDTALIRLPVVGRIVRSFSVARITRVLGVLLNGKVPLLESLALARQTVGNAHFIELVSRTEEAVTRGSTMSSVLGESDLIDPSLVEAIRSGEQSGQVAALLLSLSDFLDEENEVIVKSLTSILEPVILIGLGILVGFIAISMFLPMFDLTAMAQRGGG